jgi:hypothetical protein
MADQLPDWFTGGHGWDPSRLGDADTNTKYAIANYAIQNGLNLNNPDRNIAEQIFNALKARFPQLSLVNPDTIDLGNGDGTIGVRPNDRNTNWDARQGQWGLDWIDPYHSNSQSNSAQAVAGTAPANVLPAGWQFPAMPRATAGTNPYQLPNTGIGGNGPGGIGVPDPEPSDMPPGSTPPWLPPDKLPTPTDYPSPGTYDPPNDQKNPKDYPDQSPDQSVDIEDIVKKALSRVMI